MRHLLVVEDEVVVAIFLEEILRDAGYDISVTNDAEAALEAVGRQSFDGAVIDVGLPGISGIELTRALRALEVMDPIVLATGSDSAAFDAVFKNDQMLRILEKPYEGQALLDCLQELGL